MMRDCVYVPTPSANIARFDEVRASASTDPRSWARHSHSIEKCLYTSGGKQSARKPESWRALTRAHLYADAVRDEWGPVGRPRWKAETELGVMTELTRWFSGLALHLDEHRAPLVRFVQSKKTLRARGVRRQQLVHNCRHPAYLVFTSPCSFLAPTVRTTIKELECESQERPAKDKTTRLSWSLFLDDAAASAARKSKRLPALLLLFQQKMV